MSDQLPTTPGFEQTYDRIKSILADARQTAYRAINSAMVAAYWEVGRTIVEEEQRGRPRATYGTGLLPEIARRLAAEFGKGFDRYNLGNLRAFYLAYPIRDAMRPELSWTRYRLLLRVASLDARRFYEQEAVKFCSGRLHSFCPEGARFSRPRVTPCGSVDALPPLSAQRANGSPLVASWGTVGPLGRYELGSRRLPSGRCPGLGEQRAFGPTTSPFSMEQNGKQLPPSSRWFHRCLAQPTAEETQTMRSQIVTASGPSTGMRSQSVTGDLRSQTVTSSSGSHGGRRYALNAFTEN
jgi:hypothetical protein